MGVPHVVDLELGVGDQDAARVGVFSSQLVLKASSLELCCDLATKVSALLQKWDVLHGERVAVARRASAEGGTLDLDLGRHGTLHHIGVAFDFRHVEALDQGETENGTLVALDGSDNVQAQHEPLPEVRVQRTVDFLEVGFVGASILTYNCVTLASLANGSGCWALHTKNEEMCCS